jgi:hypothetical protein
MAKSNPNTSDAPDKSSVPSPAATGGDRDASSNSTVPSRAAAGTVTPNQKRMNEDESQERIKRKPRSSIEGNERSDTSLMPPPSRPSSCVPRTSITDPLPREWTIGVHFKFLHNCAHRVYEGPPDGTPRVRLSSNELFVDFNKIHRVTGIYADRTWTAVSFEVTPTDQEGHVTVWTNVRKDSIWWAKPFLCIANQDCVRHS